LGHNYKQVPHELRGQKVVFKASLTQSKSSSSKRYPAILAFCNK
jgi:hypothetical protein